jgi:hypothetical protein
MRAVPALKRMSKVSSDSFHILRKLITDKAEITPAVTPVPAA